MRRSLAAILAPLAIALIPSVSAGVAVSAIPAGAALAQSDSGDEPSAGELTSEAVDRLLRAFEALLGSIPQYEAPYVNEDGDIIIRRKHPERDDGDSDDLPDPGRKPIPPDIDTTTT